MSTETPPRPDEVQQPAPPGEKKQGGMTEAMFGGAAGAKWLRDPKQAYADLLRLLGPVGIYPLVILLGVSIVERFDQAAFGLLGPEVRDAFHLSNAGFLAIPTTARLLPLFLSAHVGYITDPTHRSRFAAAGAVIRVAMSLVPGL